MSDNPQAGQSLNRQSLNRWWGWGIRPIKFDISHRGPLLQYLRDRLGVTETVPMREFAVEDVKIPPCRLTDQVVGNLRAHLDDDAVLDLSHSARVTHSLGKSYRDLVRLRSLNLKEAPDAVLFPKNEDQIRVILKWCETHRVALIPFGGGTSVVGGVEANRVGFPYLVSLDMSRLNQILDLDPISETASVEAGIFGPELERQLGEKGYTLGHFPQSFEFSTLGGWIAARSAGQNSIMYGGIERLVVSVRAVTPRGVIETLASPAHAVGPDTKEILTGSEGVCGIIVKALVRIRKKPAQKNYSLLLFSAYWEAVDACRGLVQSGLQPAMIRISDEEETAASLAMGASEKTGFAKLKEDFGKKYLAMKGFDLSTPLSAVMVGFEGTDAEIQVQKAQLKEGLGGVKYLNLGTKPGQKWLKDRFFVPYLRDELMDQNLFVETLETVTEWSRLEGLYRAVRTALVQEAERQGVRHVVYCHVSHLYRDGASLYFTIIAQGKPGNEIAQWNGLKLAANKAILQAGGGISHHHGVGEDHRNHLHWSPTERMLIKGIKQSLDPMGLLNPGKLFDSSTTP